MMRDTVSQVLRNFGCKYCQVEHDEPEKKAKMGATSWLGEYTGRQKTDGAPSTSTIN